MDEVSVVIPSIVVGEAMVVLCDHVDKSVVSVVWVIVSKDVVPVGVEENLISEVFDSIWVVENNDDVESLVDVDRSVVLIVDGSSVVVVNSKDVFSILVDDSAVAMISDEVVIDSDEVLAVCVDKISVSVVCVSVFFVDSIDELNDCVDGKDESDDVSWLIIVVSKNDVLTGCVDVFCSSIFSVVFGSFINIIYEITNPPLFTWSSLINLIETESLYSYNDSSFHSLCAQSSAESEMSQICL